MMTQAPAQKNIIKNTKLMKEVRQKVTDCMIPFI